MSETAELPTWDREWEVIQEQKLRYGGGRGARGAILMAYLPVGFRNEVKIP